MVSVISSILPAVAARKLVISLAPRSNRHQWGALIFHNSCPITMLQQKNSAVASSTAIVGMVPDSVKEAVKSSVLDEATRHDSKLWGIRTSDNSDDLNGSEIIGYLNGRFHPSKTNDTELLSVNRNVCPSGGRGRATQHSFSNSSNCKVVTGSLSNNSYQKSINSIARNARFETRNDPLEEWHLREKPKLGNLQGIKILYRSGVKTVNVNVYADPFKISKGDMQKLSEDIRTDLIGSDHPVLTKAASYFFEKGQDGGKKIRPMMVLLLSRAMTSGCENKNPLCPDEITLSHMPMPQPQPWQRQDLPQAQRRLAEISEMIHTASLFHDDVIDEAHTRRQSPSVHQIFGNKMAILAGDYLLARASIFLARLRDVEVVETMSTIIEHLVRGEVMQMKGSGGEYNLCLNDRLVYYLRKNFYKTASLMANSCKSAAILGGYNDNIVGTAYSYGKHLGVAFQLTDDILDFDGSTRAMGKPLLADLTSGVATAPVLFAAEIYPNELQVMIDRKFRKDGDIEKALEFVRASDGIQRTKRLALVHAELAVEAVLKLGPSVYRDALVRLAYKVVERST